MQKLLLLESTFALTHLVNPWYYIELLLYTISSCGILFKYS